MSFNGTLQELGACAPGLRDAQGCERISDYLDPNTNHPTARAIDFRYMVVKAAEYMEPELEKRTQVIFARVNQVAQELATRDGGGPIPEWPKADMSPLENFEIAETRHGEYLWRSLIEHRKLLEDLWADFVAVYGDYPYKELCAECEEPKDKCTCNICGDCDQHYDDCTCHDCETCGNHEDDCECCSECEQSPDDCTCNEEAKMSERFEKLTPIDTARDEFQEISPVHFAELWDRLDNPLVVAWLLSRIVPVEVFRDRMLAPYVKIASAYAKLAETTDTAAARFAQRFGCCVSWWRSGNKDEVSETAKITLAYLNERRVTPNRDTANGNDVPHFLFLQLNEPSLWEDGGWVELGYEDIPSDKHEEWRDTSLAALKNAFTHEELEPYWENATR